MFLHELTNLFIVLFILAGPFLLVWLTRAGLRPLFVALLYTVTAIFASGMIWSPTFGYGGFLMLTLPFSPVIGFYGWLGAKLSYWWMRGRMANTPGAADRHDHRGAPHLPQRH